MRVAGTTVPLSTNNGHTTIADPFLFHRARTWWLILSFSLLCTQNGFLAEQISPGRMLAKPNPTAPEAGVLYLATVIAWTPLLALMARQIRPVVSMMLRQKAVLAFPALALLSTLWSSTPEVTIRKALFLFLACAFGWFLAVAYTPEDQMRLFLFVGAILGILSICVGILVPRVGLDFQGQWKGVFGQKNTLGTSMLFLFSALPFCRVPNRRKLLALVLQALLPICLMVMADSKEALVSVGILICARLGGPFLGSRRREQLPFVIYATLFATAVATLGYNVLFVLLNRDPTLTGRTNEWSVLIRYVPKHFWLGYGYSAFWNGSSDSLRAMHLIGGSIHGADSGYLDTMLQFGVIGLALWVNLLFVSLRDITRAFLTRSLPLAGYWYGGLILAIFALSFVWGGVLTPGSAPLVLALSCAGIKNIRGIRIEGPRGAANGSSVSVSAAA